MTAFAASSGELGRRPGDGGRRVHAAPGQEYREVLPLLNGRTIQPGEEFRYAYRPDAGQGAARYEATAFCIDIVFDDGSRLSQNAVDQYGVALTPSAQDDAKMLWIDQWNLRRVSLNAVVGRTVQSVEARFGPRTAEVDGCVDMVEIGTAPVLGDDILDAVRTTRGSWSSDRFSRGNTVPLVASPHGQVFGLPMTDASTREWCYTYDRRTIEAFATSHIPSPWMGDRGVFEVMPSPLSSPDRRRKARGLAFNHGQEIDRPHLYSVVLDGGITASMTASESVVALRCEFSGAEGSMIFDHLGTVSEIETAMTLTGFCLTCRVDDPNEPLAHYIAVEVVGAVAADGFVFAQIDDDPSLGHLVLDTSTTPVVDIIVGVSTISAREAARHRDSCGGFDAVRQRSAAGWRPRLNLLEAKEVSDTQWIDLVSDLYRLFLYPNAHEENGRYRSPENGEVKEGRYSANNGFWDTYRTCWPALALLTPDDAGKMASGFVEHFLDGGWTARWSAPGPVEGMTGTSSDTVFTDLAVRDVPGLSYEDAYRSAVKNATVPSPESRTGRKGLRHGIFRGYIDVDTLEGMSWTLDNAINDSAIARLARLLAESATGDERERLETESNYFARRGLGYRAVFHRGLGFFLGRQADGSWRLTEEEYDPRIWGYDYTETNGWGTAFTAPHDGAGLAELYGGEAELGHKLDAFFTEQETAAEEFCGSYGFVIHEMAEAREIRMGMFGLSNQPAHHIPFMYMFAGRHDDAHRIVTEVRRRCFAGSDFGQGFPGDEDNGEMAGWHLFTSLGLYPLVPGSGEYVLVPPAAPSAVVHLPGGDLEIVADKPGAPYIRRVLINGQEWNRISVPHADLIGGVRIEFELSDEPCGWASDTRPASISTEFSVSALVDATVSDQVVTDNLGDTATALAIGDSVTVDLTHSVRPTLYTVTGVEPATGGWLLEGRDAAGAWRVLDRREEETFDWTRQTRPFGVRPQAEVPEVDAVRLTALRDTTIAQLEIFGDE